MKRTVRLLVAIAALAICTVAFAASTAPQRIVLYSPETDSPAVLVFDRSASLDDYRADACISYECVSAHAFVVDAGTSAIVVQVRGQDVGIKITSGPAAGRYGWVLREAAHVADEGVEPRA